MRKLRFFQGFSCPCLKPWACEFKSMFLQTHTHYLLTWTSVEAKKVSLAPLVGGYSKSFFLMFHFILLISAHSPTCLDLFDSHFCHLLYQRKDTGSERQAEKDEVPKVGGCFGREQLRRKHLREKCSVCCGRCMLKREVRRPGSRSHLLWLVCTRPLTSQSLTFWGWGIQVGLTSQFPRPFPVLWI